MSDRTVESLNRDTVRAHVAGFSAVRRMAITLTARVLWQLAGFRLPDGSRETMTAEVFAGIGLAARPPSAGKPEAIVVNVGSDAKAPVVIAVRDQATAGAVAGALAEDETMVFTSQAVVYLKSDGTIEARSPTGVAQPLATKADLDALANWIHSTMVVNATGATAGTTTLPPSATGTTRLKGE